MHRNRSTRRLLPWACILTLGLAAVTTGRAQPQPPDTKNPLPVTIDRTGAIIVPLGGLATFSPPELVVAPTDILVSNDLVLRVRLDPADPKKLLLTGLSAGVSQLTIVRKDLPPLKYDVIVQTDYALLRAIIKRTVPTASVDVQPGLNNSIVLSGYVTSPQDADTVARLANSAVGGANANVINAVQVGGVQQVEIDVVVASVDRNQLRSRGFDFAAPGRGSFGFSSLVSGLIGVQTGAGAIPTFSTDSNLQAAVVPNRFFGALRALRSEGVAKFLAEPRVVTQTGRPAFFRAGGQQAILSSTSGITGPGVTLVPFGTELEVVPIVYGNGSIWLDINPRITAVSQALGITVGGASSPGFTEQSVRSTVLLESGQTFAIGGLIQNSVGATSTKIPLLGDLPFSGTFFSRVDHTVRESELVILVTPRLVHPMDPCQTPKRLPGQETRTPDDYELFLENVLEVPRGQRKVWNGKCYNAPYKSDPTLGKYPCVGGACANPNGTFLPNNAASTLINPLSGSHQGGSMVPAPGGAAATAPAPMAPATLPPTSDVPAALPPIPAAAAPEPAPILPPVGGLPVPQ
ncbi:pilus assembly protein N-terminal domain-containing protein [Gemmata sp. G18]|uniref:Pilus assembly protein N-terminal domain-containing protein n=1 Tax=Gemmata palustris TaxID=2822762 RepID=A0ABS5BJG6_9BACT|nr:pilus assembly protein N-terminal domain-containing protein [Gemmata palustris]MBP3953851.1 pilus assembly protein N-terminal domain-containing protein [Gemmata palustris]